MAEYEKAVRKLLHNNGCIFVRTVKVTMISGIVLSQSAALPSIQK